MGRPVEGAAAERFHQFVAEILGHLDVPAALPYTPPSVPLQARLVLAHGYQEGSWHDPFVLLTELDVKQLLVKATYFFTGDQPDEVWRANGEPITPLHGKVRDYEFYGRTLVRQRIVWLPSNRSIQLDLGGSAADIFYERPHGPVRVAPPGQIRWWLNPASARASKTILGPLLPISPQSKKGRTAKALARSLPVRKKYADAWVLMDRVHDAADSGEILFRHLRQHHPDINAWFVLEKGGKEWERFKAEGHGDRLVAYGSMQWRLLLANAAHLLSSHADAAIVAPPEILEFTHPGWRFHFLQHGVIKDDLSAWLDPKKLDTVRGQHRARRWRRSPATTRRTSSPSREVALTGLPRFDRLRRVGLSVSARAPRPRAGDPDVAQLS